jgi:Acetyltransferase (GNAT) domain
MEIVIYRNCSELTTLEERWDHLGKQGLYFVPSFPELRNRLEANGCKFRLLAALENSQITAIACFIYGQVSKTYEFASRTLFRLPVKMVDLFGSCVLGEPGETVIRKFFQLIIEEGGFDVINVGRIFVDSPLYKAVNSLDDVVVWQVTRKTQLWWLIKLPDSFDEYISSLRKTARAHITRDYRRFERQAPEFRMMRLPEEVDIFLRDAETISHLTYQWNLNYGLCSDGNTRQKFLRLAENGSLRCYITYVQGKPCAFGWGELNHGKFHFRQTGYDPQYRKLSPGSALILRMIRDLIENTDCKVFDFLWGGDDGYKSRLATFSTSCASIQAAPIYRPYSRLIAGLDQGLNLFKNLAGSIVERGPVKARLRSVLRRYGVGTF